MNITDAVSNATKTSSAWFLPRLLKGLRQAVEDQATEIREQAFNDLFEGRNFTASATVNSTSLNSTAIAEVIAEQDHSLLALSLNYFVSPYAGACMTMAIILNRTIVFASSRSSPRLRNSNPLNKLGRGSKILLRLLTLCLICNTLWHVVLQFSYINPELYVLISKFHRYKKPIQSVRSSLWEVFLSIGASQFIETLVSITSGQTPSSDSALTLFEYSLVFQEAQFDKRPTPQLLTIVLFALASQIVNQISGIFHWKKYQLIPSTILGIGFLSFSIYSLLTGSVNKFPTAALFSILPQIMVLGIITFCLSIYGVAVLLNGTTEGLTYTPMMKDLKNSLNLQLNDDFNSVILRFGFIMFTAVDNEEYVNELSNLKLLKRTYLEAEGSGHLISGYFNNFGNNPELLIEKNKKELDAKIGLGEENNKISNVYSFLRKYANLWKLLQSLYLLAKKSLFKKKGKDTYNATKLPMPEKVTVINKDLEIIEVEDDSEDFQYESESDADPLELDSDAEFDLDAETGYVPNLAAARARMGKPLQPTPSSATELVKTRAVDELFNSNDLLQLISPQNLEEASYVNSLKTHLIKDMRLTRSKYAELNQDDLLKEVILQQRPPRKLHNHDGEHLFDDTSSDFPSQDLEEPEEIPCVVCQTNHRSVILWPCKCLAICETCRLNLGVRGFKICVCCRRQVDGFSKIYIP